MDSLNNLQINCKKCNVIFAHGDHVVLTSKIDFFHYLCYKSKGRFFKFFNNPINFITWTDSKTMIDDYSKAAANLMFTKQKATYGLQQHDLQPKALEEMLLEEKQIEGSIDPNESEEDESKPILSENLMQLISEVNELKQQINYFSDEKIRDENLIKSQKFEIQKLKMQVQSLRWQLNTSSSTKISIDPHNNNNSISLSSD